MNIGRITKEQTQILKGAGILLIVLHNFLHNLTPVIGENQVAFSLQTFQNFYHTLLNDPLDFFRATFSYFGHYGVQIFVFFSAYGLTVKYHHRHIAPLLFLGNRISKIYFSFLLCVAVYVLLGLLKESFLTDETVLYWDSILWKLLLVSNFIPHQALMPVGPWWFLPFIFQFYILFPILLKLFRRYGGRFLLLLAGTGILSDWLFNPYLIDKGLNLNYFVFGHLPVVCAGMYLASKQRVEIPASSVWLLLLLFVLGNFNEYVWTLSGVCFTILVLTLSNRVSANHAVPGFLTASLAFFGGISFYLFIVNGFLRSPFHQFAESYNLWWVDLLAAFASLLFSTLFALFLSGADKRMRNALSQLLASKLGAH